MAFNTVPVHGKLGALYVLHPNGFVGSGLNDLTWGTGSTAADLTLYEVVIDSELGGTAGVDTFKWRVNGGAWTAGVDITGAAQTLADGQQITFAATTGHTDTDQWIAGNLKDEPTSESAATAQITDTTARMLNPNRPPTWTDDGGETATLVNYTNGHATFTDTVGNVIVTGTLGYIPAAALVQVGYLTDWSATLTLEMADASKMGSQWKEAIPGQAGGTGTASGYFIASQTAYDALASALAAGNRYYVLQLFTWDAAQDQTGDHLTAWVTFDHFDLAPTINAVVKETLTFTITGPVSWTADA